MTRMTGAYEYTEGWDVPTSGRKGQKMLHGSFLGEKTGDRKMKCIQYKEI